MITIRRTRKQIDGSDDAIEVAFRCLSSVISFRLIRGRARFFGDSSSLENLRNHWIVDFDLEKEDVLASTASVTACIDNTTGEIFQLDWDHSKRPLGRIV